MHKLLPTLLLIIASLSAAYGQGKFSLLRRKYKVERDSACGFDGSLRAKSFVVNQQKYQVKYGVFCTNQFSVVDTVKERATVVLYPEQNVRIQIVSASAKEVVIKKDLFNLQFAGDREWPKLSLGTTTIDQIDQQNRRILFSTFVGYPYSDRGWLLKYAVDLSGRMKYLGLKEAPQVP